MQQSVSRVLALVSSCLALSFAIVASLVALSALAYSADAEVVACIAQSSSDAPVPPRPAPCRALTFGDGGESDSGLLVTVGNLVFPLCKTVESDPDGDGYGWENEQSCVVYSTLTGTSVPVQAEPSVSTQGHNEQLSESSPVIPVHSLYGHVFNSPVFRQQVDVCEVRSLETLRACVSASLAYSGLDIKADLSCSGDDCCAQNAALLALNGNSNFTIHGNNHLLRRESGHRQCSLLEIVNADSLIIENWHLDDDSSIAGCVVADDCPRMVHIRNSKNITLENVHITNGKAYNVYIDGVDGFTFQNSSIVNAGILGLYVGHGDNFSSRVTITNSLFADIQTNAVALLGVGGSTTNVVSNNSFLRNHRYGHWAVAPKFGVGTTGGGQIYIARADNVLIQDNTVMDGYCENCFVSATNRTGIHGIELGEPNRVSLSNISVTGNLISNNDGSAIYLNEGNSIDATIFIDGNTLLNNTDGVPESLQVNGATVGVNDTRSTAYFESFEGVLAEQGLVMSAYCASDSTVTRVCDGQSLHGSCAVELNVVADSCVNSSVSLASRWFAIGQQSVSASGWLIRGSQSVTDREADWCLEFADDAGQIADKVCKAVAPDDDTAQGYIGLPFLNVEPAAGSVQARWVLTNRGESAPLLLDDVKLTGIR